MKPKNTIILLTLACAFAAGVNAQNNISNPTSKEETDARIAARAQLTSAPTVYIWMFDAEMEYDENNKPTNPKEYKNTTGDKNDNYYLIKMKNGTSTLKISNNIIKSYSEHNDDITNYAKLLPNYGYDPVTGKYSPTSWTEKPKDYRLARIKIVDDNKGIQERDELTTIRGRGNSTWECNKKSYRLKFPSKVKLLAKADGTNQYAEAKSWTLLANAADRTMLRNALTSQVVGSRYERKTGVNALPFYPACKFVDLVLNNIYIGTYQISDHVQIQKERINIDEDNGWLVEGVSTEEKFIEDPNIEFNGIDKLHFSLNVKNPEDKYYTDDVATAIRSYFTTLLNFRNPPYDFSEATGLFKYLDMENVVEYFIGTEVSGNFDGLISNYAYRDINPDDKLMLGPLWDSDIAFGNFDDYGRSDLVNDFVFNQGKKGQTNPLPQLVKKMVENSPEFVNLLVKRWEEVYSEQPGVRNGNGLSNHLEDRIDEMVNAIKDSQKLNYTPIANGGAGWSLSEPILFWVGGSYRSYDEAVDDLKDYIYGLEDDNHKNLDRVNKLNNLIHQLKNNITKSETYVLDANFQPTGNDPRYYIPEAYRGKICNVRIQNRTFEAGKWNTICLPFSLDYDQLKATFGNEVQLLEYSSIVGNFMKFTPVPNTRLVAGVPYLLKFSANENVKNPTFQQVGISCPSPATISYDSNPSYSFVGTYFKTSIATDGTTLLLNADKEEFEENNDVNNLAGLSAYITCPSSEKSMPVFSNWILLDNDGDNNPIIKEYENQTVSILVNGRTLYTDGSWNSLCLPFEVKGGVEGTIFEGASLMTMEKAEYNSNTQTLVFNFNISKDATIPAGEPFFVKWDDPNNEIEDIEPTFKDVVITETSPLMLYGKPEGVVLATDDAEEVEGSVVALKGLFDPLGFKKAGDNSVLYLGSNNTLYYPNGKMTIGAFRAYFQLLNGLTAGNPSSASGIRAFELNFENDETGISTVSKEERFIDEADIWYTLDGRRLSSEPKAPGIYINRGRKVVIK